MPHLVILYSANLDRDKDSDNHSDITSLCRRLADTMLEQRDDAGKPVFPIGGTRVLAYPAPHFAVADGQRDYAFAYLNLRMNRGRSEALQQRVGQALLATARTFFDPVQARRLVGVTLHIDVGAEVYDGKLGNLHPLFQAPG